MSSPSGSETVAETENGGPGNGLVGKKVKSKDGGSFGGGVHGERLLEDLD